MPEAVIVNRNLKESLNSFIKQVIKEDKKQNSIMVYTDKISDTTFIVIVNSIPDITKTNINGMLNVNSYHVYFTGALSEQIYTVRPEKVYELSRGVFMRHETEISDIKYNEPLQKSLIFFRDSLINNYRPSGRIYKLLHKKNRLI